MRDRYPKMQEEKSKIRFRQAESYSPYCELCVNGSRQLPNGATEISINGFYRYDSIMQPLFKNKTMSAQQKEWLFDIYMHYLAEVECRRGGTYQDYGMWRLWIDIEKGMYGKEVTRCFDKLTDMEQDIIVHALFFQQNTGESVERFAETLMEILQAGVIYKTELKKKELYIYIGDKKNEDDITKIYVVQQLFQPIGYDLRIFWEDHFVVWGEEQTMRLDEIELL